MPHISFKRITEVLYELTNAIKIAIANMAIFRVQKSSNRETGWITPVISAVRFT